MAVEPHPDAYLRAVAALLKNLDGTDKEGFIAAFVLADGQYDRLPEGIQGWVDDELTGTSRTDSPVGVAQARPAAPAARRERSGDAPAAAWPQRSEKPTADRRPPAPTESTATDTEPRDGAAPSEQRGAVTYPSIDLSGPRPPHLTRVTGTPAGPVTTSAEGINEAASHAASAQPRAHRSARAADDSAALLTLASVHVSLCPAAGKPLAYGTLHVLEATSRDAHPSTRAVFASDDLGADGKPRLHTEVQWIQPARAKMGGRIDLTDGMYLIFSGGKSQAKVVAELLNGG